MTSESPVLLRKLLYRGTPDYHLTWEEGGQMREANFPTEADAVVEMHAIEERLKVAAMAGKGLTVNPFGELKPFITSKDVHFAALRLQPRGLDFRTVVTDYVAAEQGLKPLGVSVPEAARIFGEAAVALKPFDTSVEQAVFEWVELKRQVGDTPFFELLRAFMEKQKAASAAASSGVTETPTVADASAVPASPGEAAPAPAAS